MKHSRREDGLRVPRGPAGHRSHARQRSLSVDGAAATFAGAAIARQLRPVLFGFDESRTSNGPLIFTTFRCHLL